MHHLLLHVLYSLLALSALPIRAAAEDPKKLSPEEVFRAFAAAMKKEDIKTSLSLMTRDSQAGITSMTIAWSMVSKEFSADDSKDGKARIAAIDTALKRHGVTVDGEQLKALSKLENSDKQIIELGAAVKDKPAFAGDFHKIITRMAAESKFQTLGNTTIHDPTIDGSTAKARVIPGSTTVSQRAVKSLSLFELALETAFDRIETVFFRMEDGVWKIDLIETWKNVPPPPVSKAQPATPVQPPAVIIYPAPTTRWCLFPRFRR